MKVVYWLFVSAFLYGASAALAVTNGANDNTRHPEVGTIVAEYRTPGVKDQACTGTLVSPTVFLTAGHCVALLQARGVTQVWVTFDPVFSASVTLLSGTMYLDPAFPGHGEADPEDLGIIVLDSPVIGITPASLPSLGLLDRMSGDHGLNDTLFTIVGYGATDTQFGSGPPDATQGKGTRRFATEGFLALNSYLLKLDQKANFGFGGSSTGDSGAPNFLGTGSTESSIVVAITFSGDRWGLEQNVAYRLDTPEARTFLSTFVMLP